MYYAHSLPDRPQECWQPLVEHLRETARIAERSGEKFGAGRAAYVAGLLHDLGKYTEGFQARLKGGERVDHATAGAQEICRTATPADRLCAEIIAYAIAGHHSGLPDRRAAKGSTLDQRMKKALPPLAEAWRSELGPLPRNLAPEGFRFHPDLKRRPFQLSMLGRFLFSCLVDADFRDTEAFYARAEERAVDRDFALPLVELKGKLAAHLSALQRESPDSDVNRQRRQILEAVLAKATEAPGLFSLTVPTGGGKTLASLAFALDHALRNGMDRVIYAIPFTSIIDQTATTFRRILRDEAVLEHHSAIDTAQSEERDSREKLRLAMEDWSAPVVVTTNVQLFESLFSNRRARCRKLHNLAKSVIILDEAQSIPLPVLQPCVAAIDELARNYRTSLVLCTATQPALMAPEFKGGLDNVRELAPDPQGLERSFRRVTFRHAGDLSDHDLVMALHGHPQALVIVNSRKHALDLYRQGQAAGLEGLVHLTTRMVAADRRRVLEAVRTALKAGRPCRVIATSLVEAGVDLDFPLVWRAEAGLDSILQAAGRCNREGKRRAETSLVTIFRAAEAPSPREIQALASDMERAVAHHADLATLEAIQEYFSEVYWRKGAEALDSKGVLNAFRVSGAETDFAFRTVAEGFRLIEEGMAPVVVPRDEKSRDAVRTLPYAEKTGGLARKLQPYVVQVPPKTRESLIRTGRVRFADKYEQFAVLEDGSLYEEDVGLVWENAEELAPAASIL